MPSGPGPASTKRPVFAPAPVYAGVTHTNIDFNDPWNSSRPASRFCWRANAPDARPVNRPDAAVLILGRPALAADFQPGSLTPGNTQTRIARAAVLARQGATVLKT